MMVELKFMVRQCPGDSLWGIYKSAKARTTDVVWDRIATFISERQAELFQRYLYEGSSIEIDPGFQELFDVQARKE